MSLINSSSLVVMLNNNISLVSVAFIITIIIFNTANTNIFDTSIEYLPKTKKVFDV